MFDPEHFVAQCDAAILAGGGAVEVYERSWHPQSLIRRPSAPHSANGSDPDCKFCTDRLGLQ
jgi:hypothetical protein